MKQAVLGWFGHADKSFYLQAFQTLVTYCAQYTRLNIAVGYAEKINAVYEFVLFFINSKVSGSSQHASYINMHL